jgi:hypothetical protein
MEALAGVLLVWARLALALAEVIGRGIWIADDQPSALTTADVPTSLTGVDTSRR